VNGRRRAATGEGGTGLIGSVAGLLVFLAMMLFAVQTLVGLYTRSVVTDAAHEGARRVAGARVEQGDPAAQQDARIAAEGEVRRLLGRFGDEVTMDWSGSTADTVALRVRATPPGFLWNTLRGPGAALVDRTVTVRIEQAQ
jgi:Flp pilus assembly protein TadG